MGDESTRYFFNYFRARAAAIRALEDPDPERGLSPDQSVLLATAVDALAKYWAELYMPALCAPGQPARRRMQEFLLAHARSDIFERVSGPDLRRRALDEGKPQWVDAFRRLYADADFDAMVRRWTLDLPLAAVLAASDVRAAGVPEGWIRRSTYGEVLYTGFRCAWVHELAGGEVGSRPFLRSGSDGLDEPHYSNRTDGPFHVNRYLVFPRPFLLATLDEVIDNFELACMRDGRTPAA
ncbi:MAG: hypothetical protein M5U28_27930 [Sandaracinaceae bacterium]|nr:hypothetical protein [Sandaracinaceae bacterium]